MNEGRRIIVASNSGISIRSFRDISDAIAACLGAGGLILTEDDLAQEFFDLRSGLAGELFQKFINYRVRVGIVVPDIEAYGLRISEPAYQNRSSASVRF